MTRVFIDSSVFFSAACPSRGHARDLILMALGGETDLVLSRIVIEETRRNLLESAPESVPVMELVLQSVSHEIIRPSREQVITAAKYTALKDAAIAAAAREAAVDLLVTLDRKHLLGRPDLARHVGADIVMPQEAVRRLMHGKGSKMRKVKHTLLDKLVIGLLRLNYRLSAGSYRSALLVSKLQIIEAETRSGFIAQRTRLP